MQSKPVLELKTSARELLAFLVLWVILFIEPLYLGPLKIAHLWKIVVLAYLIYETPKPRLPIWLIFGVLYALKYLVYTKIPYGLVESLQNAAEALILPLLMWFLYNRYRLSSDYASKLLRFSVAMAFFFIYSAVPFLLGLEGFHPDTSLDKYGLEMNATKGLFYHIAVASQVYTLATLVLMSAYGLFKFGILGRIVYLGTVLIGVYLVYGTFARTAWLAFIAVALFVFFSGYGVRRKLVGMLLACGVVISAYAIYETNEAVQLRMSGGATYRQDTELSVGGLVSARVPFVFVAADNLSEAGLLSIVLGYGAQYGMDLFEKKTGMAIVSHNKTMEILEASGLVGLFLYLGFVGCVFRLVKKGYFRSDQASKKVTMVCGLLFAFFYLGSHGLPFWGEAIISGVLVANILRGRPANAAVRPFTASSAPWSDAGRGRTAALKEPTAVLASKRGSTIR